VLARCGEVDDDHAVENYGVIVDTQTIAQAGKNWSIDWFCFPRFDSPSVFAAILDDR
jgi:GH15 family glucan-1,4-alpha-glucosidase